MSNLTKIQVNGVTYDLGKPTDATLTQTGMPADAGAVGNEKNVVRSNYVKSEGYITEWLQGTISASGSITESETRCRNSGYLDLPVSTADGRYYIEVKSGYQVVAHAWSASNSHTQPISEWSTGTVSVPFATNSRARIVVSLVSGANISPIDITTDAIKIYYYSATDTSLSEAGKAADAAVVGSAISQFSANSKALGQLTMEHEIPFFPFMFVGGAYRKASDLSMVDSVGYITIVRRFYLRGIGGIHLYVDDNSGINFKIFKTNDEITSMTGITDDFVKEVYISGEQGWYYLTLGTDTKGVFLPEYLQYFHAVAIKTAYEQYLIDNCIELEKTGAFGSVGTNGITRNTIDPDTGFAARYATKDRVTGYPHYSHKKITLFCPYYANANDALIVCFNNSVTTIQRGQKIDIPANTYFGIGFVSGSGNADNTITEHTVYIVDGTRIDAAYLNQYLCNRVISRADTSFLVDNLLFMIAGDDELYHVFDLETGQFITSEQPLGHAGGHANSCNYNDGYCYVSHWYEANNKNNLIYVFAVNPENHTLTYERDIELPVDVASRYGRTEYYVQNNEKEIYFLGWQTGASGTLVNCLVYGLYIKVGEEYILSWERKAARINTLQSFTKQGGYLFLVEVDSADFHTTGICSLNMATGEVKTHPVSGIITSYEAEGINPIGDRTFLITDSRGRIFFYAIGDEL